MAARNAASKVIYADKLKQYIWRGGKLKTHGAVQYNQHIYELTQKSYYHGQHHSWADKQFYKTRLDIKGYWSSSIVKYLVNAHISYMAKTHNY